MKTEKRIDTSGWVNAFQRTLLALSFFSMLIMGFLVRAV